MNPEINLPPLTLAEFSIDIAFLPSPSFRKQVAEASLAITKQFENKNIIDETTYPAHLSLYLGGTNEKGLQELKTQLAQITLRFKNIKIFAEKIQLEKPGFIAVKIKDDPELIKLHQLILEICQKIHQKNPCYRPNTIKVWSQLNQKQQTNLRKFGTYKVGEEFKPHISLAIVPQDNTEKAFEIAEGIISTDRPIEIEALQLVEIGHNNELWKTLESFSI